MHARLRSLLLALAACAPLAPAHAAAPADGPGCLGVRVEDCVRWLRATMTLDEPALASALARRQQTDVNGRPLRDRLMSVTGQLPGSPEVFVILLHLRLDDTVERAEANLQINLIAFSTAEIYDQSRLYDLVWRLLGRRCPAIDKLALYRFFENSVKPRITNERKDYSTGLTGLHRIVSHAAPVPFCGGASLAYTNLLEWRGANDPDAAPKRTQFSSIELR